MTLADVNVWLALALSAHQHHVAASEWMDATADQVAFCRSTQQSLLRLLTTKAVLELYGSPPLTNKEAWELCAGFQSDDRISFLSEPPGLDEQWERFAAQRIASPKLWMDAYLAAFALAAGCKLVTTDKAFAQFTGLRLELILSD